MPGTRAFAATALVMMMGLVGCTTYVNIPPHAGDLAKHDINARGVRNVCIQAIKATLANQPIQGSYAIVLPGGADQLTYETVVATLGGGATSSLEQTIPVLEVRQIRIRADNCEVDLIRPADSANPRGPGQLVTVYLKWNPLSGWDATRLHPWRAPVEQTLPGTQTTDAIPVAP